MQRTCSESVSELLSDRLLQSHFENLWISVCNRILPSTFRHDMCSVFVYLLNCSGPSIYECLACHPDRKLKPDKTCAKICNSGFYYLVSDDACYLCDGTCLECRAATPFDCKSCHPGYYFNFQGDCLAKCPDGTYTDELACTPCSKFCQKCSGPNIDDCLSCPNDQVLRMDHTCATSCLPQQFVDGQKICQPCDKTCQTCSGPNENQCLSCVSPTFTFLSASNYCKDCLNKPTEDEETCWFNSILGLTLPSQRNLNINASSSLRITFRNESRFLTRLTPNVLQNALKFEV